MIDFSIQYRDNTGSIKSMSVSMDETSRDIARQKVEWKFRKTFPTFDIIHIG